MFCSTSPTSSTSSSSPNYGVEGIVNNAIRDGAVQCLALLTGEFLTAAGGTATTPLHVAWNLAIDCVTKNQYVEFA